MITVQHSFALYSVPLTLAFSSALNLPLTYTRIAVNTSSKWQYIHLQHVYIQLTIPFVVITWSESASAHK